MAPTSMALRGGKGKDVVICVISLFFYALASPVNQVIFNEDLILILR